MKVKIECSEKELLLINKALDFYSRVGSGQFTEIVEHPTFQKVANEISKKKNGEIDYNLYHQKRDNFKIKLCHARDIFTEENHGTNGNWGIFNEKIDESCVIAYNLQQQIRYELWKSRGAKKDYCVDNYPADACKITNLPEPDFKIEIK